MKCFVALGVLTLLALGADCGVSMHNPFFCYTTDTIRPMTNMFSLITSYEAIRRFNFTTVNPYMSTCTPSRFWYLGRDGARLAFPEFLQLHINFAESSVQNDIVRNYEAGRTTLCRPDFEAIRDFNMQSEFGFEFSIEDAGMVQESGVIAMQNIAKRFQQTFPNILTETFSPNRFHFRHTNTARSNASIRAFASGLFGEAESQNVVYEDVPEFDWLLTPSNFCPAFSEEISNSTDQQVAFRQGPEVEEMLEQVNRKLGFHSSNQLSFNQIFAMWNWCRFKTAITFEISESETGANGSWCAPFSVAHHLLFEYYNELFYFYSFGYGVRNQRLLENLNCGIMQDLLTHMQSENDADQMARIFLANHQEIMSMMVALGSFRDVFPMHQHNFAQQSARHWLTSLIIPFSANLAVVRYDCNDGDHDLIFLLNERPILVPGCDQQTGVCKLSVLVNRFQRFINANCEVSFCSMD